MWSLRSSGLRKTEFDFSRGVESGSTRPEFDSNGVGARLIRGWVMTGISLRAVVRVALIVVVLALGLAGGVSAQQLATLRVTVTDLAA